MTISSELELRPFVLLRLGERRFAVAADDTAELVSPSRVFSFPHRTPGIEGDRKSTRLNSSHDQISYAVFCLKKKTNRTDCLHMNIQPLRRYPSHCFL